MSKMQRNKGAQFEREVCEFLTKLSGQPVKRVLGQARDGGHDIAFGDLLIECKRRATLSTTPWVKQVTMAAQKFSGPVKAYPTLVMRADAQDALFACRLIDLEPVVRSLHRILEVRTLLA